jgi:hypothetical protein
MSDSDKVLMVKGCLCADKFREETTRKILEILYTTLAYRYSTIPYEYEYDTVHKRSSLKDRYGTGMSYLYVAVGVGKSVRTLSYLKRFKKIAPRLTSPAGSLQVTSTMKARHRRNQTTTPSAVVDTSQFDLKFELFDQALLTSLDLLQ